MYSHVYLIPLKCFKISWMPHLLSLIIFCFPCLFFLSFFLPSLFLLIFCIFLFFLHLLFLILLYWCLSISTFVFVLVSFSSSSSSAFFLVSSSNVCGDEKIYVCLSIVFAFVVSVSVSLFGRRYLALVRPVHLA